MDIYKLLTKKQATILKNWNKIIIEAYHPDTAKFLKENKNEFTNPVGHVTAEGIEEILNCIIKKAKKEVLPNSRAESPLKACPAIRLF